MYERGQSKSVFDHVITMPCADRTPDVTTLLIYLLWSCSAHLIRLSGFTIFYRHIVWNSQVPQACLYQEQFCGQFVQFHALADHLAPLAPVSMSTIARMTPRSNTKRFRKAKTSIRT